MKRLIILSVLAISGCSAAVPMVQRWPAPPCDLTDPAPLDTLRHGATLTDLMRSINTNYGRYHIEAARIRAWNQWYRSNQAK
jgi:hypothetical protein